MHRSKRKWGLLLLLSLSALFVVAYLWGAPEHSSAAPKLVNKVVATTPSVNHVQAVPLAPNIISADGLAAVPIRSQLANVSRVRTAASFQEWLAQFPTDQQAKITAFNEAHFGIYRVNSREQVAWMAENGYPMPEDVLAAERMSDRDLLNLAEQGNDKAAFLLAERQNRDLVTFLDAGGDKQAYYSGTGNRQRVDEKMALERLVKQSNSPYKGFLQAQEATSGLYADQGDIDAHVIAGLCWAEQLGDLRAGQFLTEYVGQDGQRLVMLHAATLVSLNGSQNMAFMERSGGRRPVAVGGGIPGGFEPVH